MRPAPHRSISRPLLTLGAIAGCMATLGLGTATSRDNLERSFAKAIDAAAPKAVASAKVEAPRDGSEEFWLSGSRAAGVMPTSLSRSIAIGDRVSLSVRGEMQDLEVVEVRALADPAETRLEASAGKLLLVTCRETGNGQGLVRFLVDDTAASPALRPRDGKDRSL